VTDPRHGALYVGRLSEEKGLQTLLEAWKDFDYPLKIIGAGPLSGQIEAAAEGNVTCVARLACVRNGLDSADDGTPCQSIE
jgi:glycosyltransferase involved in cell wall biosynthesis